MDTTSRTALVPKLVVDDADAAIAFYRSGLGARLEERHDGPAGAVHLAVLDVAGARFAVKDADDVDPAPPRLGGSAVVLALEVPDVDAAADRLADAGAEVVFPVADREYGHRDGRLRDPFGHVWRLSTPLARPARR